jgi:uncharacterized protein (UPF0276 family)
VYWAAHTTRVGIASGDGVAQFLEAHPGQLDYVELPFELLRHDPRSLTLYPDMPLVLHCASMSVAGFVAPDEGTVAAIEKAATATGTPWLSEHLAFMSAAPIESVEELQSFTERERMSAGRAVPTSLHYTVCPQLSEETLDRAVNNARAIQQRFGRQLILENPPQYFEIPGSTMSHVDFVAEFFRRCDCGLLLDLTHLIVSSKNASFDPHWAIERFPLERVVEVHISGLSIQGGVAWDDHALAAGDEPFALLEKVVARGRPKAVTFEYNWEPRFPNALLLSHIERARKICEGV